MPVFPDAELVGEINAKSLKITESIKNQARQVLLTTVLPKASVLVGTEALARSDRWIKYPGMRGVTSALRRIHDKFCKTKDQLWDEDSVIDLIIDMARSRLTIDTWTGDTCREGLRGVAQILRGDWNKICQELSKRGVLGRQIIITADLHWDRILCATDWPVPFTKEQILSTNKANGAAVSGVENLPSLKSFTILDIFPDYATLTKYATLSTFHFIKTTQAEMRKQWSKSYLKLHSIEDPKTKILLSNHRLKGTTDLQLDKDCYRLDNYQVAEVLIILDKNTPLYLAFAKFMHHQFEQSPLELGIKSGHRGAASDNLLGMRFFYAPGSLEVYKKLRKVCMPCRLSCKKFALTRQGPLPEGAFQILKPFFVVNLDLFGPYLVKSSTNTRGTRGTKNTVKVWGLVLVCRFSHAVWIELCEGTSTGAVADALSRHQAIWGAIGYAVTDQLKSQLKVLSEGAFIEQIRLESWKRTGFLFEEVPVSRHAYNGFCEVRIRGIRRLIGKDSAHINTLSALEFTTIVHHVCNLINSTPLGSTLKDGATNPILHVLTPNHFLVPRRNLVRAALSPIQVDSTGQEYFNKISGIFGRMLKHYEQDILPLLLRPLRAREEEGGEIKIDNLVLFKRKAQDNFLPGWSLGRVVKTIVGKDGQTRAVILRYTNVDQNSVGGGPALPRDDTDELHDEPGLVKGGGTFRYTVVNTHRSVDELIVLDPVNQQLDMLELLMTDKRQQ